MPLMPLSANLRIQSSMTARVPGTMGISTMTSSRYLVAIFIFASTRSRRSSGSSCLMLNLISFNPASWRRFAPSSVKRSPDVYRRL